MFRRAVSKVFSTARAASRPAQPTSSHRSTHHLRLPIYPPSTGYRVLSSTTRLANDVSKSPKPPSDLGQASSSSAISEPQTELQFKVPEPRLSLTFTCTVTACSTRSTHEFARRSYECGIVIVQCPGCRNRHLIADHLGWFKESTEEGKLKTIEDFMRAKGEVVQRGRLDANGDIEYVPE